MHRFLALSMAAALSVAPGTCLAQEEQPSEEGADDGPAETNEQLDEAARLTFQSAREAFIAGDYETALARFRQAYQLSQRPGLLYNIAQTLDRLRRDEETVDALQEYLDAFPDAPNRSEVEARIRVLEASLAERAPDPEPDPGPEPDPATSASTSTSSGNTTTDDDGGIGVLHPAIFLAVGGLALVGGGLAIWTGLETLSLNDDYNASNDRTEAQRLYDDANTYQTVTNVLIFTSAGLAAGAVVLAILTDWDALGGSDDSATARLRPSFGAGPSGGQVGLEGSF